MTITSLTSSVMLREVVDSWRLRLEETQDHYREAKKQYRESLQAQPDGRPLCPSDLELARQAESRARVEFTRMLRIFTELTVHGKMPEERSVAGSNGV